ncbi:nucleolar complex protein 3 homolog [Physella acuta]|uniref:nucleolar complex protein 3 homolog n=1 Tax=Physella acuta TaxID=109671 RepID=UPI0027DE0637|nr:nucleolar complex protein 3 homolog [Physella acuta]
MKANIKKKSSQKTGLKKKSSHKASILKLANKRTNRLAKQGKLHKAEKKKTKRQILQEKANKKLQEQQQKEAATVNNNVEDEESEDYTDEDTEHFQFLKNASAFARTDLNFENKPRGKKRKATDDEEEEYENQPRSFSSDKDAEKMKMMLPIIDKGKVIKRMMKQDEAVTDNSLNDSNQQPSTPAVQGKKDEAAEAENKENEPEGNSADQKEKEKAMLASMTAAQLFVYRKNKLAEKKQKISVLSHAVLEDPQSNMKKLKELRLMLGENDAGVALTVRKYAMVSLMEVFKDIVPGYRLRIPTEKEKTQRVKKETKSLWDYEASFLLSYKVYLEFLETMAKGKHIEDKSFLTKHGIQDLALPQSSRVEFGKLALRCLCEMLVNHPHFNYRNNIIAIIVPFSNHKNIEYSTVTCDALKNVFKQDKSGEVSLEVVKNIGRMVKKLDFDVQPQVLETFLELQIKEVELDSDEYKLKKMKRKEKMLKLSRRERKRLKMKEALDKELLETKATADRRQKLKMHTEIIQAVFETYIRVIKLASDSALLPAVLEGLAKFAHLINVEYFDSLFAAFNSLIESGLLTSRETLHCMQTAFTILSGQGSVINIDPANFYRHFYCTLLNVHAGSTSECASIVLTCLDSMINKRRRQISKQRILAFIKRLSTLSLQQTSAAALAYLASVRQFLHTYKYSDILFDTEAQGSGVYLPYLEDPEHCCANTANLWELHLLRRHYDRNVQLYSKHLIKMAPLAGEHQLPQDLARKSPQELYQSKSTQDIFHKIPEKSAKKRRVMTDFSNSEFGQYTTSVLESVSSLPSPTIEISMDTS